MESESTNTSLFRVGDWVICASPGPLFGRAGEIVKAGNDDALERGIEWWVMFTMNGGAGFAGSDLIPDPRPFAARPAPVPVIND